MTRKFRFESLLKIRENVRDEKKLALQSSEKEAARLSQELDEQTEKIRRHIERWKTEQQGIVSPDLLLQFRNHQEYLKSIQADLKERLDRQNRDVEQKRDDLNEAIQDVKILENLREKIDERNRQEERKNEQKQLDEIARTNDRRFAE